MIFFYNILTFLAQLFLPIIGLFSTKISLFVNGRKNTFTLLKDLISDDDDIIWFHTASLGEFEQGLPVIEKTKQEFPNHKILITFFSPSGYEVKKDSTIADIICYLPLDTKANAKQFLAIVKPKLAIFVKYEFWPNYLIQLQQQQIPTVLISGIFRPKHIFFKWYGTFMRKRLATFNHFFIQDENSKQLLATINITNTTVSGDTRFDRVLEILDQDNTLSFLDEFKNSKTCIVAGSTWSPGEELLINYINSSKTDEKYIIAPHNIKPEQIKKLSEALNKKTILYSEKENASLATYDVLILDTIGLLTKVYSYADIAYVGGGIGNTGLHNTLEPAVFGVPIIIGTKYSGFLEAEELVQLGGLKTIANYTEFSEELYSLLTDHEKRAAIGKVNKDYVRNNAGASIQISNYIRKLL